MYKYLLYNFYVVQTIYRTLYNKKKTYPVEALTKKLTKNMTLLPTIS